MTLRLAPFTPLLLALVLAGCGGNGDDTGESPAAAEPGAESNQTFDVEGIDLTFEYPEDLQERNEIEFSRSAGSAAAATGGVGIDETNLIAVQRFDLETEVTKGNLGQVKREADALFSQLAGERASGERTTVGGLPALEYDIDLEDPANARTRAVTVFDGAVEYLVNCQSTPEHAEQIDAACDLALETLEVE